MITNRACWLLLILAPLILVGCATPQRTTLYLSGDLMPPLPNGVYDVSQVDVKPRFVHREAPRYPYTQYDEETGPSGEGDIMFTVRADGSISDAIVAKATNPLFGRAALQSILRSRFKPALVSGQPVDCRTLVPILIGSSGFDDVFLIRSNEFGIHAPKPYDPPNP